MPKLLDFLESISLTLPYSYKHTFWMLSGITICYQQIQNQYNINQLQKVYTKNFQDIYQKIGQIHNQNNPNPIDQKGNPDQRDWIYTDCLNKDIRYKLLEDTSFYQQRSNLFQTMMPLYIIAGIVYPVLTMCVSVPQIITNNYQKAPNQLVESFDNFKSQETLQKNQQNQKEESQFVNYINQISSNLPQEINISAALLVVSLISIGKSFQK